MTIRCFLPITSPLILAILSLGTSAYGQCSAQPPDNPWSVPPNSTVYYALDPSLQSIPAGPDSPSAIQQITNAFNAWTTANTQSDGSGTVFAPADASHAATVTVSADHATGGASATTSAGQGLVSATNPATLILHPYAVFDGTSTNAYQATAPGYNTAYLQVGLHEVGHLMGINDFSTPPSPGPTTSVMLPFMGVNDNANTSKKTGPTYCDKVQAARSTKNIANTHQGAGSGGGGSGPSCLSDPSPSTCGRGYSTEIIVKDDSPVKVPQLYD